MEVGMESYKPAMEGKVRSVYDLGEYMIIVATDRISAFDVILDSTVPDKGRVLNKLSEFWFGFTKDIVPNHLISTDTDDMPEFFRTEYYKGRSMKCRKLSMLPFECIVRGYLSGSGYASYKEIGKVSGIELPAGLKESDKLPEPIFTPTTKAEQGLHDEQISFDKCKETLERLYPGKGATYAEKIKDISIEIYSRCAEYALSKGIIIADTKFEFGLDEEGNIVLGDEVLTPDSSRFWQLDGYVPGRTEPSYDKQYVRDWLKSNPGNGNKLTDEVIEKTREKYLEAYKKLTGKELEV